MSIRHWFGLFAFFHRLWFRRAWIAREATFAKRTFVLTSTNLFPVTMVLLALEVIDRYGLEDELCKLGRGLLTGRSVSNTEAFVAMHTGYLEDEQGVTLDHAERLAIEPRDAFIFLRGFRYIRERSNLDLAGTGTMVVTGRSERGWDIEILPRVHLDITRVQLSVPRLTQFP